MKTLSEITAECSSKSLASVVITANGTMISEALASGTMSRQDQTMESGV